MAEKKFKQLVYKGKTLCMATAVPYPPHIVRQMKKAGYTVKEVK